MQGNQITEILTGLPNVDRDLAEKLVSAGITSYDELAAHGSIEVALKICDGLDPGACYNILYTIEGAIRGVRWYTIPKEERNRLQREFDHAAGH
jgi:DNA transformation protein